MDKKKPEERCSVGHCKEIAVFRDKNKPYCVSHYKGIAEEDVAMIKNPDRWPKWPFLPMTREPNGVGLLRQEGQGYVVILANLFTTLEAKLKANSIKYASAEAVVADGWRVD
jgi:hypothetical protein